MAAAGNDIELHRIGDKRHRDEDTSPEVRENPLREEDIIERWHAGMLEPAALQDDGAPATEEFWEVWKTPIELDERQQKWKCEFEETLNEKAAEQAKNSKIPPPEDIWNCLRTILIKGKDNAVAVVAVRSERETLLKTLKNRDLKLGCRAETCECHTCLRGNSKVGGEHVPGRFLHRNQVFEALFRFSRDLDLSRPDDHILLRRVVRKRICNVSQDVVSLWLNGRPQPEVPRLVSAPDIPETERMNIVAMSDGPASASPTNDLRREEVANSLFCHVYDRRREEVAESLCDHFFNTAQYVFPDEIMKEQFKQETREWLQKTVLSKVNLPQNVDQRIKDLTDTFDGLFRYIEVNVNGAHFGIFGDEHQESWQPYADSIRRVMSTGERSQGGPGDPQGGINVQRAHLSLFNCPSPEVAKQCHTRCRNTAICCCLLILVVVLITAAVVINVTQCDRGQIKELGASLLPRCTSCPEHSALVPGPDEALLTDCKCNRGYTGPDGGPCEPCSVGTYKDSPGHVKCQPCSRGSYSDKAALSVVCACVAGGTGGDKEQDVCERLCVCASMRASVRVRVRVLVRACVCACVVRKEGTMEQ